MDVRIKDKDMKFKFRVSVVLIVNGKLLVDTYSENSYCLPGGYVEIGENSVAALKREAKEELNFDVEVEKMLGVFESFFTNSRGEKTHEIDFFYKVKPYDMGLVNLDDYEYLENDKGYLVHHYFKWLEVERLEKYDLLPNEIINHIKSDDNNIFHGILKF